MHGTDLSVLRFFDQVCVRAASPIAGFECLIRDDSSLGPEGCSCICKPFQNADCESIWCGPFGEAFKCGIPNFDGSMLPGVVEVYSIHY
jgi:hypothetical protein